MKFAMNAPVLTQVVTLRCRYNVVKAIPQGEVSATAKAIVKEVAFNRWTNYARAEDVTEFNAAEKADVILRVDLQSGIKIPIGYVVNAVVTRKRSGSAAVLIDIRAHVDRTVKAEAIHWWRRRRRDLLIDLRSGLQRSRERIQSVQQLRDRLFS